MLDDNDIEGEVVIVDDNSPDGTADLACKLKNKYNVQVILRKNQRDFASAVYTGIDKAKGDIFCVMDGDLSHPPEILPIMFNKIDGGEAELVVGSRHVKGGGIENWPASRKLVSKCASLIARPLTNVKDPMSGFFMLKKDVIDGVCLRTENYNKVCLEIIVKGNYNCVVEVPYIFRDREEGESKLDGKVIFNYLFHTLRLYFAKKGASSKTEKLNLASDGSSNQSSFDNGLKKC